MRCFQCQAEHALAAGERVGFREECSACGADLHACRNCAHHDANAYNECREPQAEPVRDRERANRCDYFQPGVGSDASGGAREDATSALEGLFRK